MTKKDFVDNSEIQKIRVEMRKAAGLLTASETEFAVCASAVQIIANMTSLPFEKIVELLTNWAWDKEEAESILNIGVK